jgi:regulator of sigma E protease
VTTLLAFAFVLGVLVFVHELGHFLMARWHGVRVLTFSLGFGPKLLKVKRGDTEYAISAIPLGGYVKMAGENPEDQRTGSSDEFLSKTKWQRFQILIMGPLMNLGLAVLLMAIVLMQGAAIPSYQDKPVVIGKVEAGSAGERAGLQPGDVIIAVADDDVPTWDKFLMSIGTRADRDVQLRLLRDSKEQRIMVRPSAQGRFQVGDLGVLPDVYPSVNGVVPGSRAEAVGLQRGDVILAINDERMVFSQDVAQIITKNVDQPVQMKANWSASASTLPTKPSHFALDRSRPSASAFSATSSSPG